MALVVAACGDASTDVADSTSSTSSTTSSTTSEPAAPLLDIEDTASFVLSNPPAGFAPVLAVDRNGEQLISYNNRGCGGGIYDGYVDVRVSPEFSLWSGRPAEIEPHVRPDGSEVEILEMWDDGRAYGFASTWELADGRWVTVTLAEDFTASELGDAIDSITPVDDAEWARLTRALDPATQVDRVDPDADDVAVGLGSVVSGELRVIFHRPGDYPLGDDDCRRACYTLEIEGGAVGLIECDTYPARVRVGDHRFISAQVAPIVETVEIVPGPGVNVADSTPIEVATVEVPGMPARFYAAEVPADWCHHIVTTPDADFGIGLGEGGVLPSDPDRASCDFDVEPVPYEPPTVCHEVERDWVASTTTLREVECLDVAVAVTSSTPAAPDDGE